MQRPSLEGSSDEEHKDHTAWCPVVDLLTSSLEVTPYRPTVGDLGRDSSSECEGEAAAEAEGEECGTAVDYWSQASRGASCIHEQGEDVIDVYRLT